MNILAFRIKERREELGLSQDELARKLGYKSRSTIAKIETGENDIPYSKIQTFANALNVSETWLMGFDRDFDQEFSEKKVFEEYLNVLGWTYRYITFTDGLNCGECIWGGNSDENRKPFCEHCKMDDAYYIFSNKTISFNVSQNDFQKIINNIRLFTKEQIQLLFKKSTENLFSNEI